MVVCALLRGVTGSSDGSAGCNITSGAYNRDIDKRLARIWSGYSRLRFDTVLVRKRKLLHEPSVSRTFVCNSRRNSKLHIHFINQ